MHCVSLRHTLMKVCEDQKLSKINILNVNRGVYGVSGGPWGVRPNVGGIVGVYLSGGRG